MREHEEPGVGAPRPDTTELFGIRIPPRPESRFPIETPNLELFPGPNDYMWNRAQEVIKKQLSLVLDHDWTVVISPTNVDADFSSPTHAIAKNVGQSPGAVAEQTATAVEDKGLLKGLVTTESAPNGYVNFKVEMGPFGSAVIREVEEMGNRYGQQNLGDGKTVVLDVSSPNVAKYMSVGHLRSTVIGESLFRIYQAGGYTAIRDNHLGDWGTQFGMLGRARELWGEEIEQQMPDAPTVKKLYELYKKINDEVKKEKIDDLERLKAENPDADIKELEKQTTSRLEQEGREWFARLEQGDPEAEALLEMATALSLEEFNKIYAILGTNYEYMLGESYYVPMLPDVINAFETSGVAHRDETGALVVEFPEEANLKRVVIQKSNSSSLYSTRDLAALAARTAWFKPDRILYVVGADQKAYFNEVFAAFRELAQDESPTIEHTYFGMISLPEGKMSTRKGRVVFLEDVLNEAISRAKTKLLESNKQLSEAEIDVIARQVGVGAVIYMDLGQSRTRNINFDWDKALSLEGNSAPYIQYAHARATSLLNKARERFGPRERGALDVIDNNIPIEITRDSEKELVLQLAQFAPAIAKALEANEPSVIAAYTYRLAEAFSKFYTDAPVLSEKDLEKRNTRLRLTRASAQVIKNGLYLLGIEAPEKM